MTEALQYQNESEHMRFVAFEAWLPPTPGGWRKIYRTVRRVDGYDHDAVYGMVYRRPNTTLVLTMDTAGIVTGKLNHENGHVPTAEVAEGVVRTFWPGKPHTIEVRADYVHLSF